MGIFKKNNKPDLEHKPDPAPVESDAPWMKIAESEIGVKEVPGPGNNSRILEYHKETSLRASADSVAWCAAFANWCLHKAGFKGTNSAAALSFRSYGVPLDKPKYGCIVVFDHGDGHGHVTFFDRELDGTYISCLGGNQSDSVRYSTYRKSSVAAYRWPIV